jgi:hypothetical protein
VCVYTRYPDAVAQMTMLYINPANTHLLIHSLLVQVFALARLFLSSITPCKVSPTSWESHKQAFLRRFHVAWWWAPCGVGRLPRR